MKQFCLLTGIFLFITTFSYSQWNGDNTTTTGSIYRTGNVAIGLNSTSSHPFLVSHPGISLTSSGTNYLISGAFQLFNSYNIPSGVTESGYRMGVDINAFVNTATFTGTLNKQIGMRIQYGAYTNSGSGTINESYGLILSGLGSGNTTIKSSYGIFQTGASSKNYFEGNIGIGTTSPGAKLHVVGNVLIDDPSYTYDWNTNWQSGFFQSINATNAPEPSGWFWGMNMGHTSNNSNYRYNGQIVIKNSSTAPTMYFRSTNVNGEGTWAKVLHNQGNQSINGGLCVNGTVNATRVDIKATVPCSDYVFDQDYNLRSLKDVEQFVKTNKHLPEVPSAKEFKENGYSVGEMDDILLRKVEELTLYVIEQQKTIEQLKNKVEQLEKGE